MARMDRYKLRNMGKNQRTRTIPLTPEAAEAFEQQFARFREKFGRDPGPEDPVFFDPDADYPREMSDKAIDDMQRQLSEAAAKAGIAPEIIYAMRKTGRIITESNVGLIDEDALNEWYAAIDEYHELNKKPKV